MNAITDLFQQAQLAEAAYADFAAFPNNPKGALQDTGNNMSFSAAQADSFVKHWRVISKRRVGMHHLPTRAIK